MPSALEGHSGIGKVQSLDSRRPSAESYSTRQYLPLSPVSTKAHSTNSSTLPSPTTLPDGPCQHLLVDCAALSTAPPDVSPATSMETYMAQAESTTVYQTARPVIAMLKSFLLFIVFISSLCALELHSEEIKATFFDLSQGTKSMLFIAVLTAMPYAAWRVELPGQAPGAHRNTWIAVLILLTLLYLSLAEKFGWWPLLSGAIETSTRGWLSLGGESILIIAVCTLLVYAVRAHLELVRLGAAQ